MRGERGWGKSEGKRQGLGKEPGAKRLRNRVSEMAEVIYRGIRGWGKAFPRLESLG